MEQKYQIGNEYGSVTWDVAKILENAGKFIIREYDVKYLAKNNPFYGNAEYAMGTDITKPLIVVCLTDKVEKLIDGNHRLQKALKSDIKKIKVYYLSVEEHCKYIIDYDEQVYFNVVSHWNM